MPVPRCSYRIDLALTLIAVVASSGLAAGAVRAQTTSDPRSNVIVDLSVIDDDGLGSSSNAVGRGSGLAMPGSNPPVSRLYGPKPMPMTAQAPSLTPPRGTPNRMSLFLPRPETRVVTTPRSLSIEETVSRTRSTPS